MRRSYNVCLVVLLVLSLISGFSILGCSDGGGDAEVTKTKTENKTDADKTVIKNAVLVVLSEKDFAEFEYSPVRSALEAAGFKVKIANAGGGESVGYDGSKVAADLSFDEVNAVDYMGVVIIGGDGVQEYFDNAKLQAIVNDANTNGEVVAAICIAPVVLANAGILKGMEGTVASSYRQALVDKGCDVQDEPVVEDDNIITGNGPDAAREFAEMVVTALED